MSSNQDMPLNLQAATLSELDGVTGTIRVVNGITFFATADAVYVLNAATKADRPVKKERTHVRPADVKQWYDWQKEGMSIAEIADLAGRHYMTVQEHLNRERVRMLRIEVATKNGAAETVLS